MNPVLAEAGWDPASVGKLAQGFRMERYRKVFAKARAARAATVAKARSVTPAVKQYVHRSIVRHGEKKVRVEPFNAGTLLTVTTVDNATTPAFVQIIPQLTVGSQQGQRIGAKVSPSKMYFRGTITRANSAATGPQYFCRMVIGRLKDNFDTPTLVYWQQLLYTDDTGSGTQSIGPNTQNLYTKALPFNSEVWDIKHIQDFKIGMSTSATVPYNNNDFSLTQEFNVDCTPFLKKKWTYSTTTGAPNLFPQNDGLYVFFIPWTFNEDAPAGAGTTPLRIAATTNLFYRDE